MGRVAGAACGAGRRAGAYVALLAVVLQVSSVHGAAVRVGDDAVGTVTSVALHFEEGPIALAIVRRSTPVEATLLVDTEDGPVTAAQEVVVPPEAGATANVPRLTRLSRRASAK